MLKTPSKLSIRFQKYSHFSDAQNNRIQRKLTAIIGSIYKSILASSRLILLDHINYIKFMIFSEMGKLACCAKLFLIYLNVSWYIYFLFFYLSRKKDNLRLAKYLFQKLIYILKVVIFFTCFTLLD